MDALLEDGEEHRTALFDLIGDRFDDMVADIIAVDGHGHYLSGEETDAHRHGNTTVQRGHRLVALAGDTRRHPEHSVHLLVGSVASSKRTSSLFKYPTYPRLFFGEQLMRTAVSGARVVGSSARNCASV